MMIRGLGCVAIICLVGFAVVAIPRILHVNVSTPWVKCEVNLPSTNTQKIIYKQKGCHYAMVSLRRGPVTEDHWLPWRPQFKPINVYLYQDTENGAPRVRFEDSFNETLIDLHSAKTYLLYRTTNSQLFIGEILSAADGIQASQINNGPYLVEIGGRKACDITSSSIVTNRGHYIGRIEVTAGAGSAPPRLHFISVRDGPEQLVRTTEK